MRLISLVPSKMRLMRESRSMRSTPVAGSPRAASERSVSKPRPPRTWRAASTCSQPRLVFHSLAAAASRRMSTPWRSARAPTSSATDSIAKPVAAMSAR